MLKILEYCLFAVIIAITVCIVYVLSVSVVYATKKAFSDQKNGDKEE